MYFGVLARKIMLCKSENFGFGPGNNESANQSFLKIGCGICAYSAGLGEVNGLAIFIAML
jgi:hypothetical protein